VLKALKVLRVLNTLLMLKGLLILYSVQAANTESVVALNTGSNESNACTLSAVGAESAIIANSATI